MFEKGDKNWRFFAKNNSGQVWVETVIYTLIALTMMGAVLAFALPKIEEIQDKSIIDQSINAMKDINNVILSVVQGGAGNKRIIETNIKTATKTDITIQQSIVFLRASTEFA